VSTHLAIVVIDAADPVGLARWWSDALGWPVTLEGEDEVVVEPVDHLEGQVPALVFGTTEDPKVVKNRVHLDVASRDEADQQAIIERLLAAGATRADVGQTGDETWEVLADPEGNELCVLRAVGDEGNPLAAICLDAVDPQRLADFWMAATGWEVAERYDDGDVGLANPNGHRPRLDILRVPETGTTKNRIHLDVAPPEDGDQAVEVERLVAAGAQRADIGQTGDEPWVVLQDPEGNEVCVLTARDLKGLGPEGTRG